MKKLFKEFKAFITKGNVFDLAVGMIIATAFNKIVSSLVNDIIMPLITWATGANSLADLSLPLRSELDEATGEMVVTLSWAYGNFLQTVLDFLIIAVSVFIMVKIVNTSRKGLKDLNTFLVSQTKKEIRAEKREIRAKAKAENQKFRVLWKEHLQAKEKALEEEAKRLAEEKAKKEEEDKKLHPTQEQLLAEIRDLLKDKK